jgi:hypothetical protein
MVNFIGGLQTVVGILTINIALLLINSKIAKPNAPLLTPAPNSTSEITIIILGSLVVTLALLQLVKHLKFAAIQLLMGVAIVVASIFLYIDSTNAGYYYSPGISWLTYIVLAAGGFMVIAVLAQFFLKGQAKQA